MPPSQSPLFVASPNRADRSKPITAVVIHHTGSMSMAGTVEWFRRPDSRVSAHYVIGREGEVVQMVPEHKVAWHAGRSSMRPHLPNGDPRQEPNVNSFSIGIELVGTNDSGFTPVQLDRLYELLRHIVARYKIPPERVVGHSHIAPGRKIDPDGFAGQFDWGACREIARLAYNAAVGITGVNG